MPRVLTLIRTLEKRGFTVEAAGDKVRVKLPKPDAVEEARPLLDELRTRKAEVLAALSGQAAPAPSSPTVAPGNPCPTCGASPEELGLIRRKRALDEAVAAYEEHKQRCRNCDPDRMRYCSEGEALRTAYFDAWLAYHGLPAGKWDVWT